MSRAVRLLRRNDWIPSLCAVSGAVLFIFGCIAFYFDALYRLGVTLFLFGSLCMLVQALGNAVLKHGASS